MGETAEADANDDVQADICQLGLDQRKVNVLAREYCDQCKPKRKLKPVILSHEMMPGLLQVKAPPLLHHMLSWAASGYRGSRNDARQRRLFFSFLKAQ